jgi:photosystem II stability/assembly factor-like uncharacterized protein
MHVYTATSLRKAFFSTLLTATLMAAAAICALAAPTPLPTQSASPSPSPAATAGPPFRDMKWREIGPSLPGGRVASVAGSTSDPKLYYVGSAGGGVWKSVDGGETWSPVFEKQNVSAIGAVAIDQNNNNVVWVGTGESNPRQDVSYGDGVYKSTDGGQTWTNVGLTGTQHISRILVDPTNSNHVIVGALGNIYGDSEDRGVYVTDDGGKTWTKTLYVSASAGASDVAMDVKHPNVVYAGMWHFRREPWTFTSGGPDGGLYKSTDGGHSWKRLSGNGLPTGLTGKIGLAVAASNGSRVYAIIENKDGLLYRSDDAGATWKMITKNRQIDGRPFYFTRLEVDPQNPDRVYALAFQITRSEDGGKTFKPIGTQVHVDFHAMWIAQNDPKRIIAGEDGGIARTLDGGENWYFGRNISIGQVYRAAASLRENPYTICGGWQDNNAWCGPSNSLDNSGIENRHWFAINGGDGQFALPDPVDPDWIWSDSQGAFLVIYNKKTRDFFFPLPYLQTALESFDLSKSKYRFNWESPIAFAPWNGHIAWLGGNVVFQTLDRGRHWTVISPDLTRNDKSHQQPAGGPLTYDVSGAEYSDTILDIEGSTLRTGEIWAGTDDGLIQLTRDGGKHWRNVTPAGAPRYGRVESISPSYTTAGTAFANFDVHVSNDFKPYIYVTRDYGKHWTQVVNGLPADQYVRSVRADLRNRNIVYAGTENGMWISFDEGAHWQDFRNNLPHVAVHDIRFQPDWDDLIIATHGRGIYVMDDMRPVQRLGASPAQAPVLMVPRTAYQYNLKSDDEGTYTDYTGNNPPYGAVITYYQSRPSKGGLTLQILDNSGHVVRTVTGTHKVNGRDVPYVPNQAGLNSYVWDFNIDGPVKWLGAATTRFQGPSSGPPVPPGRYSVRMTLGGRTFTQRFTVRADPLTLYTQAQIEQAYAFNVLWTKRYAKVNTILNALDDVKKQLNAAAADPKIQSDQSLKTSIAAELAKRDALLNELTANYQSAEDTLQKPGKLREDLTPSPVSEVTPPVTEFARRLYARYRAAIQQYDAFVDSLAATNAQMKTVGAKPLRTPAKLSL